MTVLTIEIPDKETRFVTEFLKKIGGKVLTDEEKEDIGLGMLMKEADRTKKVSKATIMKTLNLHDS